MGPEPSSCPWDAQLMGESLLSSLFPSLSSAGHRAHLTEPALPTRPQWDPPDPFALPWGHWDLLLHSYQHSWLLQPGDAALRQQ